MKPFNPDKGEVLGMTKVGTKGQIILPKKMRGRLDFQKGSIILLVVLPDGKIEIYPKDKII